MALRNWTLRITALCAVSVFLGCNGNVQVSSSTSGTGGGTGGSTGGTGGATTSGGGGAGGISPEGGSSSVGGSPTGGTSAGGSPAGGTGTGGAPSICDGKDHVACLAAYPDCVPLYDDKCCPSCDPQGGCADCINIQFHHCVTRSPYCKGDPPAPPPCGTIPGWACTGGKADCNIDPGGSTTPCATVAGCVPAYCLTNQNCKTDPVCHPATAGTCTNMCDAVPPPCPEGTVAENDGFCYTGSCVPQSLCPGP